MADHLHKIPQHLARFLPLSSSTITDQSSSAVAQGGASHPDITSTEDHLLDTTPPTTFDAARDLQGLADAIVNDMEECILKPLGPFAGVTLPPSRGRSAGAKERHEPTMEWMKHLATSSESISRRLFQDRRAALRLRSQASAASAQGEGSRRPVCRICHNSSHRPDQCWFFQVPGECAG